MWTIAAANKKLSGPLGTYNGLSDVHLAHYFSTPAKISHLKDAKLITINGVIIPEQKVKVESLQNEKKRKLYDLLAQNVIQNAAHKESYLNKKLFNYLDDVTKMENVENIKVIKQKSTRNMSVSLRKNKATVSPIQDYKVSNWIKDKNKEENITLLPRSAPSTSELSEKEHGLFLHSSLSKSKRCLSAMESSPYIIPLLLCNSKKNKFLKNTLSHALFSFKKKNKKQQKTHNQESLKNTKGSKELKSKQFSSKLFASHLNLDQEQCKVTIFYHGHGPFNILLNNIKEEIVIKQQHCGGTPVTVYKGQIASNEAATFISLTHEGYTFSLTIFLDGIRYLKLSSCCVFRYTINRRLGGSNGSFSIQKIEGGKRCLKCQYQEVESSNYSLKRQEINNYNIRSKENIELKEFVVSQGNDDKDIPEPQISLQSSQSSITEKNYDGHSDINIKSEDIEENLSIKSEIREVDSESHLLEEEQFSDTNINSIGESHSDSESIISVVESIHGELNHGQLTGEIFQLDSSSDDENGEQHVVLASIHGSPT